MCPSPPGPAALQETAGGRHVTYGLPAPPQCGAGRLVLPVEAVEGVLAIVGVGLSVRLNHPLSLQVVDMQVCPVGRARAGAGAGAGVC